MHSDLKVTDGVYSVLSNLDVKERIKNLMYNEDIEDISSILKEIRDKIKI